MSIHTFGDSVLDSGTYSGKTAGDILSRRLGLALQHHAKDGATSRDLQAQLDACSQEPGIAVVSVGGNDFLTEGGMTDDALIGFRVRLGRLIAHLTAAGITAFVANVYDPSFGSDDTDLLPIPREIRPLVRRQYDALNMAIAEIATAHLAALVDLRAHFLTGEPSWFTKRIEPSRYGAREVAVAFLAAYERAAVHMQEERTVEAILTPPPPCADR
jgi:acyl-CoA thioesterase-1